jgi:serine/threonine protein kinase
MSDTAPNTLDFDVTLRTFAPGARVFDRYVLERVLGRGRKGDVWLARDERLGMDVAIKLLINYPHFHALRSNIGSLLDLTHPNIIRIYDFVGDENLAGFVMEYFPSTPLSEMLREKNGRPFEVGEISRWARDLFAALHSAWDTSRLLHRDLRTATLLVSPNGLLKISDFGLAPNRLFDAESSDPTATEFVSLPGLSPQLIAGQQPTHQDDIYAAGAVLYELLTTKPVFPGGNIILQIQRKVPPSIAERRKELDIKGDPVPKAWEQWIARFLDKDADKRPRSADEVVEWLRSAKTGQGSTSRHHQAMAAVSQVFRKSGGSEWRKSALKAAAFILVAGGAAWGFLLRPASKTLEERRSIITRLDHAEKAEKAVPADLMKAWQEDFITPYDGLNVPFTEEDEVMMTHALARKQHWEDQDIKNAREVKARETRESKVAEALQTAVNALIKDDKEIDSITLTPNQRAEKIATQLQAWNELLTKHDVPDQPTLEEFTDELARARKAQAAVKKLSDEIAANAAEWITRQKSAIDGLAAYCLTPDMSANKKLERIGSLLSEFQPDKAPPGVQAALPGLIAEVTAFKTTWESNLLAETGSTPAVTLDELYKGTRYENASQDVKREVLLRMQDQWKALGITCDPKEEGKPGKSTHEALVAWQKKHGVVASGRFSDKTLEPAALHNLDIFELEGEIAKQAALKAVAEKKSNVSKGGSKKKKVAAPAPSKWQKVGEFFTTNPFKKKAEPSKSKK